MKIEGPNKTNAPAKTDKAKKAGGTGGSSFADMVNSGGDVDAPSAPVGPAAVNMYVALQAAEHATEHENRRRAIVHASDLLDDLEDLRIGLLLGSYTKNQLHQLAARVRQQRLVISDPQIMGLLDDIALRAAVELAKYE